MKNVMKKGGWTIVSLLPVLLFLGIQAGCSIAASVVIMIKLTVQQENVGISTTELTNLAAQQIMEYIVPILMVSQLAAILVFGLWYYFVYGKRKRPEGTEKPATRHILLILALGVLAQFFISSILTLVQCFAPQLLENYNELLEQAGILEGTALTLISTVILAPLSEELVCRGVILRLAGKVSSKFWVANIIQALAFGILHGNVVQGIYAFGLGLVLGALYEKFKNIWLCMLLHAAMNASTMLIAPVYTLLSPNADEPSVAACLAILAVSGVLFALSLKAMFGGKKQTALQ